MKQQAISVLGVSATLILCLGLQACSSAPMSESKKAEKQADVRDMASKTLTDVNSANPGAVHAAKSAAGYAVFSNFGFKLLFMGSSNGEGIAVSNATRQETFMKMVELQPGLGLGASTFRVLFVFDTPQAFDDFVNSGWQGGANAMAAAKSSTEGGAAAGSVTVSPGVNMYQITDKGAIVGVSITGAKFYKDDDLN
jgi:lipid-binding SYLF domain-containing protein